MADGILAAVNENGNIDRFIDTKGGVHYIEPKRYEESVAKIDAAATKAKETVNSATEAVSECKAQTGACTQETARAKEIADTVESRITGIEGDVAALRDSVSHTTLGDWTILKVSGLTIASTILKGTVSSFANTGTSTTLYKNLGTYRYPITFVDAPVLNLTYSSGSVLTVDSADNTSTTFMPRILFNGTSNWIGASVPYQVSVIAIGVEKS